MSKNLFLFVLSLVLVFSLSACGKTPAAETSAPDADAQSAPAETAEAQPGTGRADGERFEEIIMLEGMEETVAYEHVRNETAGFELDYEYEELERRSAQDSESFISRWDSTSEPWNYLELRCNTGNAELVASALKAGLTGAYDTVSDEYYVLEHAGSCIRINASGAKDGVASAGSLQTVYVFRLPTAASLPRRITPMRAPKASERALPA